MKVLEHLTGGGSQRRVHLPYEFEDVIALDELGEFEEVGLNLGEVGLDASWLGFLGLLLL